VLAAFLEGDGKKAWETYRASAVKEMEAAKQAGDSSTAYLYDQFLEMTELTEALANQDWRRVMGLFAEESMEQFGAIGSGLTILAEAIDKWTRDTDTKFKTWFAERLTATGTWLSDTYTKVSEFDLSQAARNMLASLGRGMFGYWDTVIEPWLEEKIDRFNDLIPDLPDWLGGDSSPKAQTRRSSVGGYSMTPALATVPNLSGLGGVSSTTTFTGDVNISVVNAAGDSGDTLARKIDDAMKTFMKNYNPTKAAGRSKGRA
jgi:hypothetical protein